MPERRERGLDHHEEEPEHRRYSPEHCPETRRQLDFLQELARYDEGERSLTHPPGGEHGTEAKTLLERLERLAQEGRGNAEDLEVASFDIDLTIHLPDEDDPTARGSVPIRRLGELQEEGYIVGTCSDREPSDQLQTMEKLGFTPDFCIPKELLNAARMLLDGASLTHVGDDERRDRQMAERNGWQHLWPWEHGRL